jgi:hypothetical protein
MMRKGGAPRRVGFSANLGLRSVDPDVAALCESAVRRLTDIGCAVESEAPDFSGAIDSFQVLLTLLFADVRGDLLPDQRSRINPDIVWNIEKGQTLTAAVQQACNAGRAIMSCNNFLRLQYEIRPSLCWSRRLQQRPPAARNVDREKPMAELSEPARPSQHASNVVPFPMPQFVTQPVSIDFDPDRLANNWLPIAEIAAAILANDGTELQLAVKQLSDDGLRDLIDNLGQLEQRLLSLAQFARAASARCPRAVERH